MIKIAKLQVSGPDSLTLAFTDGTTAPWSARDLIARDTVLTRPLADPTYFARAFIEGGALAWPNGLELSPAALYATLGEAGLLQRKAA
jgi:hypothetical protein